MNITALAFTELSQFTIDDFPLACTPNSVLIKIKNNFKKNPNYKFDTFSSVILFLLMIQALQMKV